MDRSCWSSIGEEIGGLGLVPARTMRATAAECLLLVTSQAIRKHLGDHGVGAGVAPDFDDKARLRARRHPRRSAADAERPEIGDKRDSCEVRADTCVCVRAGVRC